MKIIIEIEPNQEEDVERAKAVISSLENYAKRIKQKDEDDFNRMLGELETKDNIFTRML